MTGTDLYVNKPHCTAAAQCGLFTYKSVPVIFEPPCVMKHGPLVNPLKSEGYLFDIPFLHH